MSGAAAASGGAAAPLFAASPNSLVALRNSLIDAPKLLPQFRYVNVDTVAPCHVNHVQGNDDGNLFQFQNLADEK